MTEVPVPPLADFESAQRFHQMLSLHVARLKRRDDPVGLHQFLLVQALGLHVPASDRTGRCDDCAQQFPCRTTLLTALLTRLPVPWTPVSLGRALSTGRLWPSRGADFDVVRDRLLEYGDPGQTDPLYRAQRDRQTGRWLVSTYERGSLQSSQYLDDDRQLCDFLVWQAVLMAFPFGWHTDETWPGLLDPGAAEAGQWWSKYGKLPYLESWRPEGAWEPGPAGSPAGP